MPRDPLPADPVPWLSELVRVRIAAEAARALASGQPPSAAGLQAAIAFHPALPMPMLREAVTAALAGMLAAPHGE